MTRKSPDSETQHVQRQAQAQPHAQPQAQIQVQMATQPHIHEKTVRTKKFNSQRPKGMQVEMGQDWVTGATHEERCAYMRAHEAKCQGQYAKNKKISQKFRRGRPAIGE